MVACLDKRARPESTCVLYRRYIPYGNALRHGYPCNLRTPKTHSSCWGTPAQNRLRLASELYSRQSLDIVRSDGARHKDKGQKLSI